MDMDIQGYTGNAKKTTQTWTDKYKQNSSQFLKECQNFPRQERQHETKVFSIIYSGENNVAK